MTDPTPAASPAVAVVIIGRNEGERLGRCIRSVQAAGPIPGGSELIYVDSNSSDDSPAQAQALGARVLQVAPPRPCAAIGRNAGWRAARAPLILFLDGDTILEPGFLPAARALFADPTLAVVWGHRRELAPHASLYQRVLDLDWIYPAGPSAFCGGDALMRRAALAAVDGFDEGLIAGEEPELCARLRAQGYRIEHIDAPMTRHDLAITRWGQYWRRAVRAGHAYAEVAERLRDSEQPLWRTEVRRNRLHAAVLILAALAGLLLVMATNRLWPLWLLLAFYLILVVRTARRAAWKHPGWGTRLLYGVHSHLQQVPILIGQLTYYRDRRAGERRDLIEYK